MNDRPGCLSAILKPLLWGVLTGFAIFGTLLTMMILYFSWNP